MAYNWKADLGPLEQKYHIPAGLLGALVRQESGGQVNISSPAGAIGLTQLMPGTAQSLGVNPHDPRQNLEGGAKYLGQQLAAFHGSVPKALAAYNAGPGAVHQYGGIPPYHETQQYVQRVTGFWRESPHYGTHSTPHGVAAPQTGSQGGQKPIHLYTPESLPTPQLQQVSGLDDKGVQSVNDAYSQDPAMAQAILNLRQRKQNDLTTKYNSDFTAYNARQQQIAAVNAANQSHINLPDTHPTGQVISGGVNPGKWNLGAKFVKTPHGWVRNEQQGEDPYKFIQRIGQRGFGLRNDPGITQTFGGHHTDGSEHYAHRAVDFGTALNNQASLNAYQAYMKKLGFDVLNEGDHIHTSAPGQGI